MMKKLHPFIALLSVGLTGCVGYNSTLFVTKSNFGIDLDTKPPTAEISVARREGVLAPSFEGGKTPPVMASFKVQQNGLATFFTGVGQTFAGGDSAMALSTLYAKKTPTPKNPANFDSTLTLENEPTYKVLFFKEQKFPKESHVRPFVFGTDTSLGVKVAWSGLTAQVPDTVKVGFNRKEFALAPVNLTKPGKYAVDMPSFLATVDANVTIGAPANSGLRSIQYFATGDAATQLAMEEQVRKAMLYDIDPTAAKKAEQFEAFENDREKFDADANYFKSIENIYSAANKDNRTKIENKSVVLELLSAAEAGSNFLQSLRRQVDNGRTLQLKQLDDFAKSP